MTIIPELRHRVVLLQRQITEEVDGTFTEAWRAGDTVWAKILPYIGREMQGEGWNSRTEEAQVKYKVTMRFRHSLFHRLQWEDKVLALRCPPIPDERQQWMTCLTYEVRGGRGE
jgi:head-tail adaptor